MAPVPLPDGCDGEKKDDCETGIGCGGDRPFGCFGVALAHLSNLLMVGLPWPTFSNRVQMMSTSVRCSGMALQNHESLGGNLNLDCCGPGQGSELDSPQASGMTQLDSQPTTLLVFQRVRTRF